MARSRPTPRNQPKPRISNRVNLRQAKKDVRSQKKRFRNFHSEIDFAIYLRASRKLSLVFPQKQFLKKCIPFLGRAGLFGVSGTFPGVHKQLAERRMITEFRSIRRS